MMIPQSTSKTDRSHPALGRSPEVSKSCQSIDWYAEGESRTVEIGGHEIVVRFVGRKGRRGRIAIEAPAGTVFHSPYEPSP